MNQILRKSLMATAIAALTGASAWAGTASEADPSRTPQAGEDSSAQQAGGQHPAVEPGPARTEGAADEDGELGRMADQHPGIKGTRDTELFSKSAQELEGKQVVDSSGEGLGTVESIVSSRDQPDELFAVISPAAAGAQVPQAGEGAPASEGQQMLLSLDELRWQEDKLHATGVKADLETQLKPYQADQYAEVEPADQPISEFAAFEPVPEDAAREGQSSPQEPARSPQSEQPAQTPDPAQSGEPSRPAY